MLTVEKNRQLTEVGPGTMAGKLLRQYWMPIALSSEFGQGPHSIKVLGENLVFFRDGSNNPRLIEERCPHRGTSLVGGRVEERGIRCCYHGWLFDGSGQCIEQPGEPAGSTFTQKAKIRAYPVKDKYGLIWAFLGEGEAPILPPYDILARTDGHRKIAKADIACNYFQIIENSVDPVHTAILHVETDLETAYQEVPVFECETTPIGMRTIARRSGSGYRRQTEFVLPTLTRVTLPFMQPAVQMGFWITPIDDTHSRAFFSWFLPITVGTDPQTARQLAERMEHHMFELEPENRNVISSRVMRQDMYACESQGEIVDRTLELLASSDRGSIMLRKLYFEAMEDVASNKDPLGVVRKLEKGLIDFPHVQ